MDGECEACRRKDALGLQARLVVGAGNDPLEREADRAADHVLGRPEGGVALTNAAGRLSRRPAGTVTARPVPASVTTTLRASGEPLPAATRHFFETRFGHDFGHVRVHHDAAAAASARDVAAHAYTVGHQVVFNQGRYAPATPAGQALLAHELAHVVQQTGTLQRSAIAPELEVRANPPEDEAMRPPSRRSRRPKHRRPRPRAVMAAPPARSIRPRSIHRSKAHRSPTGWIATRSRPSAPASPPRRPIRSNAIRCAPSPGRISAAPRRVAAASAP
ncbi:DUF4157 domain-containing protein [Nitrogeniibacter mangrovi]|uniref:DUF4157 domain-containing protein n=2 Tax=Nitrogeniibacter mangrovi TaxID=2016596 RepID=A0A6C1BAP0_9RHOO|nr:DUF4157 domain-containing protein [Nitrogeniibacter mangrovi]